MLRNNLWRPLSCLLIFSWSIYSHLFVLLYFRLMQFLILCNITLFSKCEKESCLFTPRGPHAVQLFFLFFLSAVSFSCWLQINTTHLDHEELHVALTWKKGDPTLVFGVTHQRVLFKNNIVHSIYLSLYLPLTGMALLSQHSAITALIMYLSDVSADAQCPLPHSLVWSLVVAPHRKLNY